MRLDNILIEMSQAKSGDHDFNSSQLDLEIPKAILSQLNNQWIRNHNGNHCYIFSENGEYYYLAIELGNDVKIIGYVRLEKFNLKGYNNTYQVTESEISKKYRGKGYAKLLYEQLLRRKNMTLVSDYSQFDGVRNVWSSLSKKYGVDVYDDNKNKVLLVLKENSFLENL